tara:strand:+ start:809 stop:1330 length:522 start_codon:yes stop_codon:yes gene_type:complete
MPDFKDTPRGYKQKGWSAFTRKTDPVKKPVGPYTPNTMAEYMDRQVWNLVQDQERQNKRKYPSQGVLSTPESIEKEFNDAMDKFKRGTMSMSGGAIEKKKKSPPFKQVDDDTDVMTPKEERKHRKEVLKYNKNVAKPLNDTQKRKIKEQLSKMDPKDPEAKLLRKMLNLKKNK